MAFSSLEKLGIVFAVGFVLYLVKFLFSVIYIYVLGPALNKVDFKSKGKWAREYIYFTTYFGYYHFINDLKCLVISVQRKYKFF